jgi:hypothetical protein
MQIRMQLSTIQKKDLCIAEYFRKVKCLADTLAAIGKRLKDEELIAYMLHGLGPGYDPLVTSITLPSKSMALLATRISSEQWHRRLGHPAAPVILRILQENNIAIDSEISPSLICNACQLGKSHQLPFGLSTHVSTTPLQLIHTDVWGPALLSVNNSKYYVSFIDDFSRYVWIYFLKISLMLSLYSFSSKNMSKIC